MNIQNIQNAAVFQKVAPGKIYSGGKNVVTGSDLNLPPPDLSAPEENNLLPGSSGLSGDQTNALQVVYPPFFPIGMTQGIYSELTAPKTPEGAQAGAAAPVAADDPADSQSAEDAPEAGATSVAAPVGNNANQAGAPADAGSILNLTA